MEESKSYQMHGMDFIFINRMDRWLRDGIQITILFPFRLRPWLRFEKEKEKMGF